MGKAQGERGGGERQSVEDERKHAQGLDAISSNANTARDERRRKAKKAGQPVQAAWRRDCGHPRLTRSRPTPRSAAKLHGLPQLRLLHLVVLRPLAAR